MLYNRYAFLRVCTNVKLRKIERERKTFSFFNSFFLQSLDFIDKKEYNKVK